MSFQCNGLRSLMLIGFLEVSSIFLQRLFTIFVHWNDHPVYLHVHIYNFSHYPLLCYGHLLSLFLHGIIMVTFGF